MNNKKKVDPKDDWKDHPEKPKQFEINGIGQIRTKNYKPPPEPKKNYSEYEDPDFI